MRPTNKQITKAANRLKFYEWTDLEITELVRRLTGKGMPDGYVEMVKQMVPHSFAPDYGRISEIARQVEKDSGQTMHLLTVN